MLFGNSARTASGSTTSAANGTVAVLAGNSIYYQPGGNGQILVKGGSGDATNHGIIKAAQAELAAAGGNVYAMAGTNQGVIQATGTSTINGHVWLTAGKTTYIAGSTSAKNANGSGGTIIATGKAVNLSGQAKISADGTTGGTVLIGGDEHGGSNKAEKLVSEYVPNADTTTISSGAEIGANGAAGAGGNIVVWSNDKTNYKGTITAHGAKGGAGGNAEVSSHEILAFKGKVDLTAWGSGATGNLLLDPSNVVISSGSNVGEHAVPINGGISYQPVTADSVLNVITLENALTTANVTVSTQSSYSSAGDITVDDALSWSSHTLTLDAYHSIVFAASVSATGTAGLAIKTNDGGSGGDYYFDGGNITFTQGAAALKIDGTQFVVESSLASLATAISNDPSGDFALANSISGGSWSASPITTTFDGILEGLGNTISNLAITDSILNDNVGLFAELGSSGVIRDLILASPSISDTGNDQSVGSLVGFNNGGILNGDTASNVNLQYTSSDTSLTLGGLVGTNGGTVQDSNTSGAVSGTDANTNSGGSTAYVGGLVGLNEDLVTNSTSSASVAAQPSNQLLTVANFRAGGLVGENSNGTIQYSSAGGGVTSDLNNGQTSSTGQTIIAGGLVGLNLADGSGEAIIHDSSASGAVNAGGYASVGGFAGANEVADGDSYQNAYIYNSSATQAGDGSPVITAGDNPSPSLTTSVGGFVGLNQGTIYASYAAQTGSGVLIQGGNGIDAKDNATVNVGGFVGLDIHNGLIEESYSQLPNEGVLDPTPQIYGGNFSNVGGFAGTVLANTSTDNAQILYSYSTGAPGFAGSGGCPSSPIGCVGGFAGLFLATESGNVTATNDVYDLDTSGTNVKYNEILTFGGTGSIDVSGLSDHALTSGLPAGWDFLGSPWRENPALLAATRTSFGRIQVESKPEEVPRRLKPALCVCASSVSRTSPIRCVSMVEH